MKSNVLTLSIYVVLLFPISVMCQTYYSAYSLEADLLSNYSTSVRPLNDQSETVAVNFSLNVFHLTNVDVVNGLIAMVAMASTSWYDERITWNPTDYGNIHSIMVPGYRVWRPNLVCASPVTYFDDIGKKWMHVRYLSDGQAFYTPVDIVESSCTFDCSYWPFDRHTCDVSFAVYGYIGSEVKLNLVKDGVNLDEFTGHGEWRIIGSSSSVVSGFNGKFDIHAVVFSVCLQRRSEFYMMNIILPFVGIVVLNPMVFLLPSESGERIGYSITVLLSITVFFTVISDNIPKSSAPIALVVHFNTIGLVASILISLVVILNLRLHHKTGDLPEWASAVVWLTNTRCTSKVGPPETDKQKETDSVCAENIREMKIFKTGETIWNTDWQTEWKDVSMAIDKIMFVVLYIIIVGSIVVFVAVFATRSV